MHTTESKWQDKAMECVKSLELHVLGGGLSEFDAYQAAATIRLLVFVLEKKMQLLDALEAVE